MLKIERLTLKLPFLKPLVLIGRGRGGVDVAKTGNEKIMFSGRDKPSGKGLCELYVA